MPRLDLSSLARRLSHWCMPNFSKTKEKAMPTLVVGQSSPIRQRLSLAGTNHRMPMESSRVISTFASHWIVRAISPPSRQWASTRKTEKVAPGRRFVILVTPIIAPKVPTPRQACRALLAAAGRDLLTTSMRLPRLAAWVSICHKPPSSKSQIAQGKPSKPTSLKPNKLLTRRLRTSSQTSWVTPPPVQVLVGIRTTCLASMPCVSRPRQKPALATVSSMARSYRKISGLLASRQICRWQYG